jgi:lipoprotein signal peptidase
MQRVDHHPGRWWLVAFFLVALLVIAADQFSKIWIRSNYQGQPLYEIGFFRIIYVQNTGAAFGLFHNQNFILTIVDFIGIALVLSFVFLLPRWYPALVTRLGVSVLGLVLGGTIGNLVDRLSLGYVTDFIYVGFWPTFNVADSTVVVGTILFACSLLAVSKKVGGKSVTAKKHFTTEEAKKIGEALGIDWSKFDVEQYRMGLDVELEHGLADPHTNVTNDDPMVTGKIALAHLNEFADYYTRLEKMEREAEGR